MAQGPNHKVAHRRRREQKTDYKKRLGLLKSGKPRAVVRQSNNNMEVQIVLFDSDGDETVASAKASDLEAEGWEHHTGNLPAAYLTGLLAAERASEEGLEDAVIDLGLQNNQHGTRIYAAVKGLVDSGLEINASEEAFPAETRIRGEHIDEYKDNGIVENFEEVKENIRSE